MTASGSGSDAADADHLKWLTGPVGVTGSGAARYAAAMHFYTIGLISSEMLEIYRVCSKFDTEDPIAVAMYESVTLPDLVTGPNAA